MMSDELDGYISRSIKNLAARHPLPKDGRERLLRAAASSPALVEQERQFAIFDFLVKYFASQTHDYQFVSPLHDAVVTPFSQSQVFSLEFASSWRLAS
jgi:hypothetical protein